MDLGQIFDVSRMREWLENQRVDVAIPSIEIHQALLVP
jgi:hypothetical protein